MKFLFAIFLLTFGSLTLAQAWQRATDGRFIVKTASPADREKLPEVFEVLQEAALELHQTWGWTLPRAVTVRVYPTLEAYTSGTAQPWYVAASADRKTVTLHVQRLRVLSERGSIRRTLRHELFHLAQPSDWPRWQAEGRAMRFAGETPSAKPFANLSQDELDSKLAEAGSSSDLARAAATAWLWASHPKLSSAPKPSSSP